MKKSEKLKNIVLSIETSVQGGSISLSENNKEVDFWQGSGSISKSEEIIVGLSRLLEKNTIEKNQIRQIVISRGPGSFTGTRIGLSIALGLKKSLNCDIYGVSVMEAMALKSNWDNIISAIPIGIKICIQKFKIGQKRELNEVTLPSLVSFVTFIKQLENDWETRFVLHRKIYEVVLEHFQMEKQIFNRIIDSGENLAELIGRMKTQNNESDNINPIYIKNLVCNLKIS